MTSKYFDHNFDDDMIVKIMVEVLVVLHLTTIRSCYCSLLSSYNFIHDALYPSLQ